jgi:hypothetical protein
MAAEREKLEADVLIVGAGPAGSVAGVFSTGEWSSGERNAAEEAVTAARTPKFAPLRADADTGDDGSLRSRRIPGAGPKPGVRLCAQAHRPVQPKRAGSMHDRLPEPISAAKSSRTTRSGAS